MSNLLRNSVSAAVLALSTTAAFANCNAPSCGGTTPSTGAGAAATSTSGATAATGAVTANPTANSGATAATGAVTASPTANSGASAAGGAGGAGTGTATAEIGAVNAAGGVGQGGVGHGGTGTGTASTGAITSSPQLNYNASTKVWSIVPPTTQSGNVASPIINASQCMITTHKQDKYQGVAVNLAVVGFAVNGNGEVNTTVNVDKKCMQDVLASAEAVARAQAGAVTGQAFELARGQVGVAIIQSGNPVGTAAVTNEYFRAGIAAAQSEGGYLSLMQNQAFQPRKVDEPKKEEVKATPAAKPPVRRAAAPTPKPAPTTPAGVEVTKTVTVKGKEMTPELELAIRNAFGTACGTTCQAPAVAAPAASGAKAAASAPKHN